MNSRLLRHGRAAAAALAVVVAATACKSDRATVFDPAGPNSYDFHLKNAKTVAAAGLPQGSVSLIKHLVPNDSMVVSLIDLHRLTSGVYQVWIADTTGGDLASVQPLVGTVRAITTHADGTKDTTNTPNVSSFAQSGANVAIRLSVSAASLGSDPTATTRHAVFVTIESAAGATTPSSLAPLYAFYKKAVVPDTTTYPKTPPDTGFTKDTATRKVTTVAFTFGSLVKNPTSSYAYFINGHGEGGVRGSTLMVDDTALARPPKGYYYAAFLVKGDASDTVYLGELTAPYPRRGISLRDADVSNVDPVVEDNPPILRYASILFDGSKAQLTGTLPYEGFKNLFISLLLKQQGQDGELPPNVVTSGTLPGIVITPPAAP